MVDHDPDFWPTFEEAEQMLLLSQKHWAKQQELLDAVTNVGQSLEGIVVICKECSEIFSATDSAVQEFEDRVSLLCPKCNTQFKTLSISEA